MNPSLVILAAGLSRRFGALKQLAPVGPKGEALLDYTLYDARLAGFQDAIFVVSAEARDEVTHHVQRVIGTTMSCTFVVQRLDELPEHVSPRPDRARPWGTGHALLAAEPNVGGPFVVVNADDFYGRGPMEAMATHLRSLGEDGTTGFAMPSYRLEDTLASSGGVSRALCEVAEDGRLLGVQELHDVRRVGGAIQGRRALDGTPLTFDGGEPVSMNMWGLTPVIFPLLRERFSGFLDARGSNSEAEFYLSTAIDGLIRGGDITVRGIPTRECPFGVTFAEDRDPCARRIAELISQGEYPHDLRQAFADMGNDNAQESTCS